MRLIASLTSPYARKVRVTLAEKKIECELVKDNPWAPDTQTAGVNPLGKVPVLVLDDGTTVFDSRVIVEYLDGISPVGRLLPEASRRRVLIKRWEALADGVLDAGVAVFLERKRPGVRQDAAWIERQLGKVSAGLAAMSEDLGERAWCGGDAFGLADIAVGCTLFWLDFRHPTIDWRTQHPNLARLADKLATRQSFRDTVPVA